MVIYDLRYFYFQLILHASFLAKNEIAIVERPQAEIIQHFPPALFKEQFGS